MTQNFILFLSSFWCFTAQLRIAIGSEAFDADATYCFETESECEQFGGRPVERKRFEAPPPGCEPLEQEELLYCLIVVRQT